MPAYFDKLIFPLDLPGPFAIVREIQKNLARYISGKLKGLCWIAGNSVVFA
jgi:hypothetical protein